MTDIEIIEKILNSKKPSDILNDDWKKTYISYSKVIHPDYCKHNKAGDAMAVLNKYKDLIENGTLLTDETGNFKYFEKRIEYDVTDDNRKLITKSYNNYMNIMKLNDKAATNFKRYMPESMSLTNDKFTINLKDRAVPLTGLELPQHHVNWIFSRMFEYVLWLNQIGYSHCGVNPTSIFVVPETHGIIVTSYFHMSRLGNKVETISAKYKMWYPTDLFTNKKATPDIDLELSKKVALYLLGDKSAAGTKLKLRKDIKQEILAFLLIKHNNEVNDYNNYRELLKKHFESKFYVLDL